MALDIKKFMDARGGVASVNEVAEYFELDEGSVRRWARENDVRRIGATFAFDREMVFACAHDLLADESSEADGPAPRALEQAQSEEEHRPARVQELVERALDSSPIKLLALTYLVGLEAGGASGYSAATIRQAKLEILAMPFVPLTPALWVFVLHSIGVVPIPPVLKEFGFGLKEQVAWCDQHAKELLTAVVAQDPPKSVGMAT